MLSRTKIGMDQKRLGRLPPCWSSIDCPNHTIGVTSDSKYQIAAFGAITCSLNAENVLSFSILLRVSNVLKLFYARWAR